ncbi:hypothetical protein ISN45_Aa07g038990 [Arabidopsis thaliana x Arabidopsis arenosa]|uniref:Transmembrane protein n=1 Tax=Arabidopsis thaliana x Arabidopsis arenosa TaxID=1240361 RepID=A0A8T1YDK5_9BRAS|nr:hypothetical protein ISN45_Aa07g038990 [Arabidopsis thaliana x Arabidopsis arenosa]
MFRRYFSFAILLIGLALTGGAYAANSSSPSPPSDSTEKSPPATPTISSFNSPFVPDYSDYEVPMNLAPDGVEIVQDYVPIVVEDEDKEADELEGKSDKKANQPKDSSASSSSSYSSSFVVFVVAAGLFLF